MTDVRITIPGRPVPKGRPRLGIKGRRAYIYTPETTRAYEAAVHLYASRVCREPLAGPVRAIIHAYIVPGRRMDLDNICKSVLDGMNGVVFGDDCQVYELSARKHQVDQKDQQRVEVEIGLIGRSGEDG